MVPGLLGLAGAAGTGLALTPALQVLTWPFFGVSVLMLGRGWYLALRRGHGSKWQRRSLIILVGSTVLTAVLWGLRFAGLLGARPF